MEAEDKTICQMSELCMSAIKSKEEIERANQSACSKIPLKIDASKSLPVKFSMANFKERYLDEYTREELPHHLVREAMIEELTYFNDNVWTASTFPEAKSDPEAKIVRSRWVLANKGDDGAPDVRARLVACEINHGDGDAGGDFYAATPPLECKRMIFSDYATKRVGRSGSALKLSFVEI